MYEIQLNESCDYPVIIEALTKYFNDDQDEESIYVFLLIMIKIKNCMFFIKIRITY